MPFTDNCIVVCSGVGILSALSVIFNRNTIYAVFSLIVTCISTGLIWLFNGADFLAFNLIIVYVGAVMVFFLFVVMMFNVGSLKAQSSRGWPLCKKAFFTGMVLVASAFLLWQAVGPQVETPVDFSFKNLSALLYSEYLIAIESAGILLLVALVAALSLIHQGPRNRKLQDPGTQIKASKAQRLKIIQIDPTDPEEP